MGTPSNPPQPTIQEWLEQIRWKPGMYLGFQHGPSLVVLRSFLDGLRCASCPDPEPSYGGFVCWAAAILSNTMPWHSLVAELGDEAAFTRFFELYDEYRECRTVYLQRAILHQHKANFTEGDSNRPQRPLELIITQYAPSKAFGLLEIYLDHTRGIGGYYPSVSSAKRQARANWNVSPKEWLEISKQCVPRERGRPGS